MAMLPQFAHCQFDEPCAGLAKSISRMDPQLDVQVANRTGTHDRGPSQCGAIRFVPWTPQQLAEDAEQRRRQTLQESNGLRKQRLQALAKLCEEADSLFGHKFSAPGVDSSEPSASTKADSQANTLQEDGGSLLPGALLPPTALPSPTYQAHASHTTPSASTRTRDDDTEEGAVWSATPPGPLRAPIAAIARHTLSPPGENENANSKPLGASTAAMESQTKVEVQNLHGTDAFQALMCGIEQVLAHVSVLPNGEASAAARNGAKEAAGAADTIKQEARPGHAATACELPAERDRSVAPWTHGCGSLSRGFTESSSTEERLVGESAAAPGLVRNEPCSFPSAQPGQRDGVRPTEEKRTMHSAPSARASSELRARVRAMLGPELTTPWQGARPLPPGRGSTTCDSPMSKLDIGEAYQPSIQGDSSSIRNCFPGDGDDSCARSVEVLSPVDTQENVLSSPLVSQADDAHISPLPWSAVKPLPPPPVGSVAWLSPETSAPEEPGTADADQTTSHGETPPIHPHSTHLAALASPSEFNFSLNSLDTTGAPRPEP